MRGFQSLYATEAAFFHISGPLSFHYGQGWGRRFYRDLTSRQKLVQRV